MRRTTLRTELLQALDAPLRELGFHRRSDPFHGERFIRPKGTVSHHVAIETVLTNGLSVSAFVAVRFDTVEQNIAEHETPHPLVTDVDVGVRTTLGVRL